MDITRRYEVHSLVMVNKILLIRKTHRIEDGCIPHILIPYFAHYF